MLHWLHYQRARFYLALRRHDQALAAFRAALAANPRFAIAAAAAAYEEASREHWDSAGQFLQQALDIEPENADYWFNIGYVHQQQNRDEEAIRCFERAVALKRVIDRAWFGLGLVHRKCGDTARAVAAFKVAAELQPMNPHAFYELAMAQLALNDLQDVHRIIRHVSGFDPEMTRRLIRETGQRPEGVHLQ
jgi:tetratricopeptide (TPR) repeat protein